MGSTFNRALSDEIDATEKADLVAMSAVVLNNGDTKIDTVFFGADYDSFIFPEVTEGKMIAAENEVVADSSLKTTEGVNLGDTIKVVTNDAEFKIVGFVDDSKFNTQPVIFTSIENAQGLRYKAITQEVPDVINGVVVRGLQENTKLPDSLEYLNTQEFIQNIPGYQAQVLTFGLMIGMLILISALVIGIFMYILTIQKQKVFGIMKAQGIPASVIGRSVLLQTIILALLGVALGLLLTFLTSLILPGGVPYLNNWSYFGLISLIMITTSAIGSLISVRVVSKIDPLEAIG